MNHRISFERQKFGFMLGKSIDFWQRIFAASEVKCFECSLRFSFFYYFLFGRKNYLVIHRSKNRRRRGGGRNKEEWMCEGRKWLNKQMCPFFFNFFLLFAALFSLSIVNTIQQRQKQPKSGVGFMHTYFSI